MKCTNCGSELSEATKFCPNCGTKVEPVAEAPVAEPVAEIPVTESVEEAPAEEFVAEIPATEPVEEAPAEEPVTEAPVTEPVAEPVTAPVTPTPSADAERDSFIAEGKTKKKNKFIGIIAIVLVVAIIIGVISVVFGGKKEEEAPYTYVADGALKIVTKLGSKEATTFEVTDDYAGAYDFSEDYKCIVYGEDYNDGEFDIYYRQVGKEKKEPVKLAKGVSEIIAVVGSIDKVVYSKNGDIYYCNNKGESEKIISDVSFSMITEDNSYLLVSEYNDVDYSDEDAKENRNIYLVNVKTNEATKIAEKVVDVDYDEELESFYTLDLKGKAEVYDRKGKAKEIAKSVEDINLIGETLYYTVESESYSLYDFVNDSMKEADAKLTEPVAPDWYEDYCPDSSDPKYQKEVEGFFGAYMTTDWDAYEADEEAARKKFDAAYEKYEEAYEKYEAAEDRIYLRESLKENEISVTYKLYSYNGSKSTVLTEHATTPYVSTMTTLGIEADGENTVDKYGTITAYEKNPTELEKIDMADITSAYDFEEQIEEEITASTCIIGNGKFVPCSIDEDIRVNSVKYDKKDSRFLIFAEDIEKSAEETSDDDYYYDYYEEEYDYEIDYNVTDIYALAENEKTVSKAEVLYEDVGGYFFTDTLIVLEDVESDDGINVGTIKVDKFSAEDVYTGVILVNDSDYSEFYYATDVDSSTYEGALYKRNGKKSEKIADDVCMTRNISYIDDKYLVITDIDEDEGTGTLTCINKNGKTYEIESDVSLTSAIGLTSVTSYSGY